MTDLLPCPQCNLVPVDSPTEFAAGVPGWGWVVHCSNFHLKRTAKTREEAVEKWNLVSLTARKPEFDEVGYPTEQTLEDLFHWGTSSKSVLQALFDFIEEALNLDYGSFSVEGEKIRIVTGGWSGNEAVIGALQQNLAFWGLCWEFSHRGGLHWFYSPEYVFRAVPPEPGSLIIDEATPFGEAEALYLSSLVRPTRLKEGKLKVGADSYEKIATGPNEGEKVYAEFRKGWAREMGRPEKTGWLIETEASSGQICYLSSIHHGMIQWGPDSTDAIRFARQGDAERMISDLNIRGASAVEHAWG